MYEKFAVPGTLLQSYLDAFKAVPEAPRAVFLKHGLGRVTASGEFELPAAGPLEAVLAALNELCTLVGPQKAFEIGALIVKYASIPPGVTDIAAAVRIFDAGYHLNTLEEGVPMYDPATGAMREGIGHYTCVSVSKHRAVLEVDVPFNCDYDRGILQTWVRRFERSALVTHLEPTVCRKTRAPRCRYEVSWK